MFLNVLDRKRSHRTKQVIRWHDGGENSRGSDGVAMYQYQSHTLCLLNSRNINVSYIFFFFKKQIFSYEELNPAGDYVTELRSSPFSAEPSGVALAPANTLTGRPEVTFRPLTLRKSATGLWLQAAVLE